MDTVNSQALSGFRICDFTGQLAGAGATKWLASFGAQVIRIEDPVRQGRWDILRGSEPFKDERRGINLGGAFNNHNTDKLGITLNLKSEKGKELLTKLIKVSDAVTENFAAGVLDRLGFGYESLKEIKPDIVYVSNCGFGHKGPYSHFKTWGPIVQAVSGLTFTSGLPEEPPAGWGYSYMDHTGGYYMAMAILAALLHRQNFGEGQWVDMACTEVAISLNGPSLLDWSVNSNPLRTEHGLNSNRSQFLQMAPHGIYPCSGEDEWIAISCRNDQDWESLSAVIQQDWTEHYQSLNQRLSEQDNLDKAMASWTVGYEKHDLQFRIKAIGVPVSAVQTPEDRIDFDTSTRDFNLWPTVEHSEIGEVAVDGNPVHFSDSDWNMNSGAPCLGEDNEKVFIEILGLSKEDIRGLKQENVI
jgi:crotonobetainyl-CoA:carnitine CoA-transferase CaiB-like acyl-CoA transferase